MALPLRDEVWQATHLPSVSVGVRKLLGESSSMRPRRTPLTVVDQ
jgi:hypothetical protein